MRNYRDAKPSGPRGGRKPSGGGFRDRRSDGLSNSSGVTMHKATCAQCDNPCEVPFKPNGKKPVLCTVCFGNDGDAGPKRPRRESFGRPEFTDRRSERPQSGTYQARSSGQSGDELRKINAKLDAILKLLS
ncbi:MAG: hypothetical protein Q8P56_02835 [Candidatus Uhrbacteria bacterium]|nr:hypothetical protein [Candidatus Uhrbacteria bacterium]